MRKRYACRFCFAITEADERPTVCPCGVRRCGNIGCRRFIPAHEAICHSCGPERSAVAFAFVALDGTVGAMFEVEWYARNKE